jgi:hypothetical protein
LIANKVNKKILKRSLISLKEKIKLLRRTMFPKKNREITGKNTSKDVLKTLISFIFLFDLDNFINNKTKLLPRR